MEDSMKKLFIYYTHSGNGELVKDYFLNKNYEIRRAIPKKELPKSFFLKIMVGGFLAGIKHKAKLIDFDSNIDGYDEIVIETPIWNGRISCPIQMVLSKVKLEGKKLTFILCSGSGKALKAVNYLKKRYNARIIELQEPKKYKEYIEKLDGIENGN